MSILIAAASFSAPSIALGQGNPSQDTQAEIWMSGNDVALWRHVPRDRTWANPDDDDRFARTMMETAQRRLDDGDRETAEWLVQSAWRLTNGRVGAEGLREVRRPEIDPKSSTTAPLEAARPHLLADPPGRPLPNAEVRPPASPTSVVENPLREDACEAPGSHAAAAVAQGNIESTRPDETWESGVRPAGHHVALAVPDGNHPRRADPIHRAPPVEPTVEPVTIALVSFAAGTMFCASLCMILYLGPLRGSLDRRSALPPREKRDSSAPAVASAAARRKGGWIVEEFYDSNVDLYGKLAQKELLAVSCEL